MSWFNEMAPRHEGYLLGIRRGTNERGSIVFRQLGTEREEAPLPIEIVQVGCDCGWRSQRLRAPHGTTWNQLVELPRHECERAEDSPLGRKPFEAVCRDLWREHAISSTQASLEVVNE